MKIGATVAIRDGRLGGRLWLLCALGLIALPAGPVTGPETVSAQVPSGWLDGHSDYAPNGVPDFSTCRPEWSLPSLDPTMPGQWTHAAPAALAGALWWLDSRAETNLTPPPAVFDTHPLVTAYPYFGPRRDDHSTETVGPLIRDLATRSNTDGALSRGEGRGTAWDDLVTGARDNASARSLDGAYLIDVRRFPDPAWLNAAREGDGAIVLLLGAWEEGVDGWGRIGGHYAAVAGLSLDAVISLSDPLADRAAEGGAGRTFPESPGVHSCRLAPREHDDAAVVSHDSYRLETGVGLPDDRAVLVDYFRATRASEVVAFAGLNADPVLESFAKAWGGGRPVMAIDAALAIIPRLAPGRATSLPPTETPAPSSTPTDLPSATATLRPFATARSTDAPSEETPPPWLQPMPTFDIRETVILLPLVSR